MDIEVTRVQKLDGDGNLKAYADVKVDRSITIKGFTVLSGKNGLFASMPRKVGKDGHWYDTVIAASDELRDELLAKVLQAYKEEAVIIDITEKEGQCV